MVAFIILEGINKIFVGCDRVLSYCGDQDSNTYR